MKRTRISDQIRAAINASGLSRYKICNAVGIQQSSMSKFMKGERGLSLAAVDRLGELLGLAVVARRKPSKRGG
jgi:predicted XRE-type DNA-binding protein